MFDPLLHPANKCMRALAFCLSGLLFFHAPGFASDTGTSNPLFNLSIKDLLKVKVTVASLFEESELDAGSSVSLLTAEQWQQTSARRVGDVLESVPSVAAYPTWGGAEAIAIRGYATELSVRGIANTLDGVPLNSFTYATSLYDKPIINLAHLDRIEMIRGPGSTLYGSDAFHGVISHRLRASDENQTAYEGTLGTNSYGATSLFASRHGNDIQMNVGLGVNKQSDQNLHYRYTSPVDGNEYASSRDYEYRDINAFATFKTGDLENGEYKLTTYVSNYQAAEFPGIGSQFFARIPLRYDVESTSLAQDRDYSGQNSNFWLTALDFKKRITNRSTIETKLYHWNSNQEWSFDNRSYPTSLTTLGGRIDACRNATNAGDTDNPLYCPHTLFQSADETRTGLQLFLKSFEPSVNTKWVAGLGQDRLKVDDTTFIRTGEDGTLFLKQDNVYKDSKRTINYALFQGKSSLSDEFFQMVYGIRIDDYSDVESHTSPRLGAIFRLTDNYTTKLLYGHAFRAPTALERLGSVQGIVSNDDIKPEEIDTIEWVNVFYDIDYELEVTLFGSKWKEGIVLVPASSTTLRYTNTGENESYGLEMSARKHIDRWRLSGSASYVRSENTDRSQDYLAFPKWILNLHAGYQFNDNQTTAAIKQRLMFDYSESDYLGASRPSDSDHYARTDLSLTRQLPTDAHRKRREFFFMIRNVFNRTNTIPSLYNAEGGLEDYGRSVNVGLRLRW